MIDENVLIYSSVAGSLVGIVREKQPMCFVEWKDYTKLLEYAKELEQKIAVHNNECNMECQAREKYCENYKAIGRKCSDCPQHHKIDLED